MTKEVQGLQARSKAGAGAGGVVRGGAAEDQLVLS